MSSLRRIARILVIDFLLLVACAFEVNRLSEKAGFPARVEKVGTALVVRSTFAPFLQAGDTLVSIDSQHPGSENELEFLCDAHTSGETVPVVVLRNDVALSIPVTLIRDYPWTKILLESLAALIFLGMGIFVVVLQREEKAARSFHHLAISIAALILLTTGCFNLRPAGLGYALEILFQCAYVLVPVLFVHFTLIFPRDTFRKNRAVLVPAYAMAAALALWSTIAFLWTAYPSVRLARYEAFGAASSAVLIFFILSFFFGFGNLLRSYRRAQTEFERRKLRWIFFGIVFGTGTHLILSPILKILTGHSAGEEYTIALSTIAPVSFAIAIVRFRVFDIDLFLKRSTVYTLVISLLLVLYLGVVALVSRMVQAFSLPTVVPNIVATVLIAFLFDPLRKKVRAGVDRKFFRVSYNFQEAERDIIENIKFVNSPVALASLVVEHVETFIPVSKIGFFIVEHPSERLKLLAHRNFEMLERFKVQLLISDLKTGLEIPVALDEAIEPGVAHEAADRDVFERWGLAFVIPMLAADRSILGFFVLGKKRSDRRFIAEDSSLLVAVAVQAGFALERLAVARELVLEQAESDRLAELSELKSFFVSSVSHDLKTPLTSIRLFAERMKDHADLPRETVLRYLNIIEGESDRLARLISNVLDFAKIEKGAKEYTLRSRDLNDITSDVMQSLEYQIVSHGFEIHTAIAPEPLAIEADYDAVFDAATNLIANAIKYSPPERKRIAVTTERFQDFARLTVEDAGFGIQTEEIEHIFDPFYRIASPETRSTGGAGIGLALVKHTMEAHRGRIDVTSVPGKGSHFVLYFPIAHS